MKEAEGKLGEEEKMGISGTKGRMQRELEKAREKRFSMKNYIGDKNCRLHV